MTQQFTFPRELRLLTPVDFSTVFQNAIRASSPYLTLVANCNELGHPRIGFAIAKKQIKRAHERNRIKRVVREYFRLNQSILPAFDIVVMARTAIIDISNEEINRLLDRLWQRLIDIEKNRK